MSHSCLTIKIVVVLHLLSFSITHIIVIYVINCFVVRYYIHYGTSQIIYICWWGLFGTSWLCICCKEIKPHINGFLSFENENRECFNFDAKHKNFDCSSSVTGIPAWCSIVVTCGITIVYSSIVSVTIGHVNDTFTSMHLDRHCR